MEDKKNREEELNIEDTTNYGEFVTSYFAWVPLPLQKEKAEEIENMTKKEDKKRKWEERYIKIWLKVRKGQKRSKSRFEKINKTIIIRL